MAVSILTAGGLINVATIVDGDHFQQVAQWAPPVALANTTATWANGNAANTEKTIALAGLGEDDPASLRRLVRVIVKNPMSVALTAQLQVVYTDPNGGTTRYADVSNSAQQATFTVLEANGDGQAFLIDAAILSAGGRLSLKNKATAASAGSFVVSVQAHAV